MKPLHIYGDRILCTRLEEKAKSLIISSHHHQRYSRVKVVMAGEGHVTSTGARVPLAIDEGDILLVLTAALEEIEIMGEKMHMVTANQVVAKLEKGQ